MNTSWLTLPCFIEGLKIAGVFALGLGAIFLLIYFLVWLIEEKHQGKLAAAIFAVLVFTFIVVMGMLTCAGILK